MVISKAAGCPADPPPCLEFVSGIRFFCSHTGDRLTALQQILSLSRSRRVVISLHVYHGHRMYLMILFFIRDISFLFHTWERPVFTSELHEIRLAIDGWELPTTRLLTEAERVTINKFFPRSDVWFSISLLRATSSKTSCI